MSNIISLFDQPTPVTPIQAPAAVNTSERVFKDYAGRDQKMFEVVKSLITGPYGTIEGKNGLFVNERNINIVSNHYEIVQPADVLTRFESLAEKTNLEIQRILLNPTNGGLMISAFFDGTRINGDEHNINVVFYTSHCGKYKTFLTLNTLRVACFNQVPTLYKGQDRFIFAEKHYKNALDLDMMQEAIENIPASVEAYNIKAQRLQDIRLTQSQFVEWYVNELKLSKEQKQFDSKVSNIVNTYQSAKGQSSIADGTAWKAFNAISFMNTHQLKNTANKAENALLKGGDDSLKRMNQLLAMSA